MLNIINASTNIAATTTNNINFYKNSEKIFVFYVI